MTPPMLLLHVAIFAPSRQEHGRINRCHCHLAGPTSGVIVARAMMRNYWIITASLVLLAGFTPAAADPLILRGEVQRGDTVVHPFEHDGHMLEFRLVPAGQGWSIWINDPADRERNRVIVPTPPYDEIDPAVIEGWHFRNEGNTGPNKRGAGHVKAPGKTRNFTFVLDGSGYQAARESLGILMSPDGRSKAEIRQAEERLAAIPKSTGVLEIEALELGNLTEGEPAWIDRLAFRLRISLP